MTEFTRRIICVVSANVRGQANALAKEVDTRGGERTFTVGLVPAGSPPGTTPTAYWCGWSQTPAEFTAFEARLATLPDPARNARMFKIFEDPYTPEQVLAELGLERWQPEAAP